MDPEPTPIPETPSGSLLNTPEDTPTPTPPTPDPHSNPAPTPSPGGEPPSLTMLLGEDGRSFRDGADWSPVMEHYGFPQYAKTFSAKYKTVDDLARGLANATGLLGTKDGIEIPGPESPNHVVTAFRNAFGVPEDPAGYEMTPAPEGLPEGVNWSEEFAGSIQQLAHKHNVPKAFIAEMKKEYGAFLVQEMQAQSEATLAKAAETRNEALAKLQSDWGADYNDNMRLAKRGAAAVEGVELTDPAFQHPTTVRLALRIAQLTGEDRLPVSIPDAREDTVSDINRMIRDADHPYHAKYHSDPTFARSVQQRLRVALGEA